MKREVVSAPKTDLHSALSRDGNAANRSIIRRVYRAVASVPGVGMLSRVMRRAEHDSLDFKSSPQYWESRYRRGGNSGAGSYGRLALFKAEVINKFVDKHAVSDVLEMGCGDGAQLELAHYPRYSGVDISHDAIDLCKAKFNHDDTKKFFHTSELDRASLAADLALSLDVIYHLVEDDVFETYMRQLSSAARRFICVYSSNFDANAPVVHVRHRRFTDWLDRYASEWHQIEYIPNIYPYDINRPADTSWADFYFFARN